MVFGREFICRKIERDEDIIENLRSIEKDFWESHVLTGIPPEPDGSEAATEWIKNKFPAAEGGVVIPLRGFDEKLQRRKEVVSLLDKLKKEKEQIEQEVKLFMGSAEEAGNQNYQIHWKNVVSTRLDSTRLKEEQPEIYARYVAENVSRRLQIKEVS